MKTTFESRVGPSPISPSLQAFAAATICAVISPAVKFRVNPAWPVAQKGQFMPHPACDEMHTVVRSL